MTESWHHCLDWYRCFLFVHQILYDFCDLERTHKGKGAWITVWCTMPFTARQENTTQLDQDVQAALVAWLVMYACFASQPGMTLQSACLILP